MSLVKIRFGDWAAITWSFYWRFCLVQMLAGLVFGILGFIVGGIDTPRSVNALLFVAAFWASLLAMYLYIRWLLSAQLGRYRLHLTRIGRGGT